jgi:hypothetical protein
MKQNNILTAFCSIALVIIFIMPARGQAFRKGAFDINLSEGWSFSNYTTSDETSENKIASAHFTGDRDPFSIEYGITSHWGIGLSSGLDLYTISPSSFYPCATSINQVKSTSTDFTIDASYHLYVTAKIDISLVGSFGGSSVSFKGSQSDYNYQYNANGGIIRLGVHARYYVLNHLGLLAMVSTFSTTDSPVGVKGNSGGPMYATTISGTSLEFGLCYRFRK